jgi:hypothetical protein
MDRMIAMSSKPPAVAVAGCALLAVAAMIGAVYFAGMGRMPLALGGTALFVLFGGLAFELARRRSV